MLGVWFWMYDSGSIILSVSFWVYNSLYMMLSILSVRSYCNDPTIGSYNNCHLSLNGILRGNQRWYGLIYKWLVNVEQGLEND